MTDYAGQADAVTPFAPIPILGSTDTTPIVIQTAPITLLEGMDVDITDHPTNTNANGQFKIHIVDNQHFQLVGSVGTGAGAGPATGNAQILSLGGFTLVADSPVPSSTQWNVPDEANADQVAFLSRATGSLKVVQLYETPLTGVSMQFNFAANNTETDEAAGHTTISIPGSWQIGDLALIEFESGLAVTSAGVAGLLTVMMTPYVSLVKVGAGSVFSRLLNARRQWTSFCDATQRPFVNSFHCSAVLNVTSTNQQKMQVKMQCQTAIMANILGPQATFFNDALWRVTQYRPTGMPQ